VTFGLPRLRSFAVRFLVGLMPIVAIYLLVRFSLYILIALLLLNAATALLAPLASRRGWFSEGRLNARLNRPKFVDESRRTATTDARPPQ
jgi:hypothetical protein